MKSLVCLIILCTLVTVAVCNPVLNDLVCPACEPQYCPKSRDECSLGFVQDPCDCCPLGIICLLKIGDRCLDATYTSAISQTDLGRYGSCGHEMACRQRTDTHPSRNSLESICTCLSNEQVCGTDNSTYDNACLLNSAGRHVSMAHRGPCSQPPHIAVGPTGGPLVQGESFALDCEVHGVPVPVITWQFIGGDGEVMNLPGDDSSIVVQTRGGPEAFMLTSWAQIMYVDEKNVGTYVCVATNSHGEATSAAKIHITTVM